MTKTNDNILLDALSRPGTMVFLDGRNEHGSHVLPSIPCNMFRDKDESETDLSEWAEEIISDAESKGFAVGNFVWTEWRWNAPQYGEYGRVELPGYWEFVEVNAAATRILGREYGEHA